MSIVGTKLALVADQPGVTRDLREGEARLGDLRFTAIDSAALEVANDNCIESRLRRLTEPAFKMDEACLLLTDVREGVRQKGGV